MHRDQRGFLEAPGLVLLVILSAQLGVLVLVWQTRLERIRKHHQQVLCLKEVMLATTRMSRQVNQLNSMLAAGKVGQGIGLLFPGTGWLMSLNWERAKKILMGLQEAAWWKRQQVVISAIKRGCTLTPAMLMTPYEHSLTFKRDLDITRLRKSTESWWLKTPLSFFRITWQLSSPHASLSWEVR